MPQNRWKYPDGSVTIKLYEPFPAGESLLLKLEDKTMDYNKAALEMHETHKGKVGIVSKVEVATRDDLSTAYTPGVAEPCRKIKENPDDVYKYTFKGNMVAVVSNGTAVLGLGDIGPEAGLPVMEGKAVLFKEFGGVDAFPICIDAHDAASVIAACKAIAPTFGGINLEDIKSPECFEIEETLERELDIPVFHDDQHGTAIVVTAALINALRVVNKKMEDVHIVLNGPGAAGTAIIKMLMTAGAKDIVAVDQFGTLYKGCNSAEAHKNWLGEVTNPRQIKGGLKEALEGADVFIGVSRPGILTTELCKTMNKDAIVFAMANPTPEIMPDEAKAGGVRVMATGRSDFPNQVNNVLCFPGLFKGALSVRARDINNEMKLAAAYAIADLITDADRSEENIIPGAFDPRVAEAVANAVAKAARETGVARRNGLHFHADDILHVQLCALARQQPLLVAMLTSHFICQRNALRLRRDKVVIFRRFLEQLRRARHRQLTVAEDDKRANIQVVVHAANRQRALQPRDGHFMRQHNSVSPSLFPNCSGAFSCAFYNLLYREIPLLSIDFPTFLFKLARLYGFIILIRF